MRFDSQIQVIRSMLSVWKVGFVSCVGIVIFQAMLGEWFYKIPIGPVYSSELIIIAAWLVLLLYAFFSGKLVFPRFRWLGFFVFLNLLYLVYSVLVGHEIYWVLRQGVFILYLSTAYFSYAAVKFGNYTSDDIMKFCSKIGMLGLVLFFIQYFDDTIPGNTEYTSTLLMLLGYSSWIVASKNLLQKVAVSIFLLTILGLYSTHTLFVLTIPSIFFVYILHTYKSLRIIYLMLGAFLLGMSIVFVTGLMDYNAVWRYLYWKAVLVDSWDDSFFLFGKGFGVQYLPDSSPEFNRLISQVTGVREEEYQLMTVPPHNGVLITLIYIGLPGVVLLLYPYVQGIKRLFVGKPTSNDTFVLLLGMSGYLILMLGNQFLEVPYAAIAFWTLYGAFIASKDNSIQPKVKL